jgi:calcium-dependent protein kinase
MEQTEEMRRKFIEMDEDMDGVLSKDELVKGYCALGQDTVDIAKIMKDCDSDRSGAIDYAEFITAAMNWKQALNDQLIKSAFDAFDVDHSGKIDIKELKLIFGSPEDADEQVWKAIIAETDLDGDGEINLEEFKHMLVKRLAPLRRRSIS